MRRRGPYIGEQTFCVTVIRLLTAIVALLGVLVGVVVLSPILRAVTG